MQLMREMRLMIVLWTPILATCALLYAYLKWDAAQPVLRLAPELIMIDGYGVAKPRANPTEINAGDDFDICWPLHKVRPCDGYINIYAEHTDRQHRYIIGSARATLEPAPPDFKCFTYRIPLNACPGQYKINARTAYQCNFLFTSLDTLAGPTVNVSSSRVCQD